MFNYFGSKARIAKYYPHPRYSRINEPFCGSAQYSLFADHWKKDVFLYDVDGDIITAWEYLIKATVDDILSLPILEAGDSIHDFGLSYEEKAFLGYMISASPSSSKKTCTYRTRWTPEKRAQVAADVHKVDHWHVELCDFRGIKSEPATWFVDPPYQRQGKHYLNKLGPMDFPHLANCVKNDWKGQVIVCEEMGATWLDFQALVPEALGQKNDRTTEAIHVRFNIDQP